MLVTKLRLAAAVLAVTVAGPALGGVVLAWLGPAGAYVLTAGCALACALLVATTRPREQARR